MTAISYHPFPERTIGLSVSLLKDFEARGSDFSAGFDEVDLGGCLRSFASTVWESDLRAGFAADFVVVLGTA